MAKDKKRSPQEIYRERKHRYEREKAALLPPGFVNHGNTCFMNSVLQGLVATNLLEDLVQFREERLLQPLASYRSPLLINGRGPKDAQRDWVQGMTIGDAFVHILERSWRMRDARERTSLSPRELLSRLGVKFDQYLDFRQQDAHEFLLHLLDGIRMEEVDIIKQRQPPPSRILNPANDRSSYSQLAPMHEGERLTSCVDMVFGGKLASVLICEACKHVSHTHENFDDLSLSISHEEARERMRVRFKTFASKFMSPSQRSRDQIASRPLSFSQPPSPPLHATTLDIPEDAQESRRRRSLEAQSSVDLIPEIPKIDIFAGFGSPSDTGIGDNPIHKSRTPSLKVSEAAFGKLGRRISVGIAMGGKKDKKSSKVDAETKASIREYAVVNGGHSGVDEEERKLSPNSTKKIHNNQSNPLKSSELGVLESVYLRRLLEEPTAALSNPLPVLRVPSPISPVLSPPWSKMGSARSIEDCFRMFTAVEVLDGDNMFGCRNCWKIANGQRRDSLNTYSDADSGASEENDVQQQNDLPLKPGIIGPMHLSAMPSLSPDLDVVPSSLPRSSTTLIPLLQSFPTVSRMDPIELVSPNVNPSGITPYTRHSVPPAAKDEIVPHSLPSDPRPIPTINAISPPGGENSQSLVFPAEEKIVSQNRSLQLPRARITGHVRESAGGLSSDESEYDDTSGVSDPDGLGVSSRDAVKRRQKIQHVSRSTQVVYRPALKRYLIAYPPPILIIHLKRFQQVSKSSVTLFGNLKKLDEYVSFPEYLDIRRFLAPRKEDYGLGKGELRGRVAEKGKRAEDQPCVYRLYGIVVHIGNMLGGHYITYTALPKATGPSSNHQIEAGAHGNISSESTSIAEAAGLASKDERQWCYISDTVVRLASLDEVLNSKAYICMYERLP